MKILYAIQGTGNGHISRAFDVIPALQSKNIDLDILVSGIQADVKLPFKIKYKLKGMSFIFGKKGGVDIWKTYKSLDLFNFRKEIKKLPVKNYDLIINDFEPVSAWAAKINKVPCVSFSHQAAVLNPNTPKPNKTDFFGKQILKHYAPTQKKYGLHFESFDNNIFTPIIREQIRNTKPTDGEHYTVYLPAFNDIRILGVLKQIPEAKWQVFSKHNTEEINTKNVQIKPIENTAFVKSLVSCKGLLCGGGFEAPAEALFLKKKLMVVPMKNQYEQLCNAAALEKMGVPVLNKFNDNQIQKIKNWVANENRVNVNFSNQTNSIVEMILNEHLNNKN